ncbi:MAG: hypothetical protein LBK99_09850 [Opitutaceae bacterium]|jgi:hypothetical protein|nr:hypothetical protein [Opitutaceae bacterium]
MKPKATKKTDTDTDTHAARLAVDFNPSGPEPRAPLNPKLRLPVLIASVVILGTLALSAVNLVRIRIANKNTNGMEQKNARLHEEIKDATKTIAGANAARTKATGTGRWLATLLNTQPFIISVLDEIGSKAVSVQSLSLKLSEGQSQIDGLEIVMLGDAKEISHSIEAMTTRLQAAGFLLVSPDPIPVNGGVRFRGKFIFPPANLITY